MTACAPASAEVGARRVDLYSRIVAFLKVLLPLAALAILATLFLLSRGAKYDSAIPFAETEVAERTEGQQITQPLFSGTTPNGDEIIVSAAVARPGGETKPAEATTVSARLTRADGQRVTLDSDLASIDLPADMATFSGDVRVATSTGIIVHTDVLKTALQGVSGNTPGRVTGTAPFGDLEAGQMEFGAKSPGEPLHMLFKSGVKLVYDPKKTE